MDTPPLPERPQLEQHVILTSNQYVLPGVSEKPQVLTGFPGSCSLGGRRGRLDPAPATLPVQTLQPRPFPGSNAAGTGLQSPWKPYHRRSHRCSCLTHADLQFLPLGISSRPCLPQGPEHCTGQVTPTLQERDLWDHLPFLTAQFPPVAGPKCTRGASSPSWDSPWGTGELFVRG